MSHRFASGRRRNTLAIASIAALALAGLAGTTSYAAGSGAPSASIATRHDPARRPRLLRRAHQRPAGAGRRAAHRAPGRREPQARAFQRAAPEQIITDIDGNTGTVRMRTNLAGFLTGTSHKSAKKHRARLREEPPRRPRPDPGDLATFHLARDYRDITGTHHLFFTQRIAGKQVLGNGLTATVNKGGHLLTVGGSPITTQASPSRRWAPRRTSRPPTPPSTRRATPPAPTTDGSDLSADGVDQRPLRDRSDRPPGLAGHRDVGEDADDGRPRRADRRPAAAPTAGQLRGQRQHRHASSRSSRAPGGAASRCGSTSPSATG